MAMQRCRPSSNQEVLVALYDLVDSVRAAVRVSLRAINEVSLPSDLPSA